MCDNLRRYRSIVKSLLKLLPVEASGNFRRHLNTLAFFINGIIASQSCQLPKIASKMVDHRKFESRVRLLNRWLINENIDYKFYYLPYVRTLIEGLIAMQKQLVIVFDTTAVGRSCTALVASVVYRKRALPIAWLVRKGPKGHFSELEHEHLLHKVHELVPPETRVIFLGDGEFDNSGLLKHLNSYGWLFAVRVSKNRNFCENGDVFSPKHIGVFSDGYFEIPNVAFYHHPDVGLVHLLVFWQPQHQEPIYLVTNILPVREAAYWYQKRFSIETLFSDHKSRGFQLDKSHLSEPKRLERLMIATALAYIWIIYLGLLAIEKNILPHIHRNKRCDLSLFQIGLRTMDHYINQCRFPTLQLKLFYTLQESVR